MAGTGCAVRAPSSGTFTSGASCRPAGVRAQGSLASSACTPPWPLLSRSRGNESRVSVGQKQGGCTVIAQGQGAAGLPHAHRESRCLCRGAGETGFPPRCSLAGEGLSHPPAGHLPGCRSSTLPLGAPSLRHLPPSLRPHSLLTPHSAAADMEEGALKSLCALPGVQGLVPHSHPVCGQ